MRHSTVHQILFLVLTALASGSCSLMSEDLEPCPEGIDVAFVYDRNVERANMFADHVGSVTVYVYDAQGQFVMSQSESNSPVAQPLHAPLYRMHLKGLQPGAYQLVAIGQQRDSRELQPLPGIRYRWQQPAAGNAPEALSIALAANSGGHSETTTTVVDQQLDTLWTTTTLLSVEQQAGQVATATLSLTRHTNRLHLSLHQIDNPADCDIADYDIAISDRNATLLAVDGSLPAGAPEVVYKPFAQWNTTMPEATGSGTEMTAHADLDFNRLVLRPADSQPAVLTIRHRSDQHLVAQLNLAEMLAQGRGAFERQHYTAQEFLDRCYDYHLDFVLVGGEWKYVTMRIGMLSWSCRIQRASLD